MYTFYVNENSDEGKTLLQFIKKLKAPVSAVRVKKLERKLTDEEMALPGFKPTDKELEMWLIQPDKDKGTAGEVVRKQLIKKLRREFSTGK